MICQQDFHGAEKTHRHIFGNTIDNITVNRDRNLRQVISVTLNTIIQNKKVSKYRLSKNSCIPYSTLSDILNGKARLEKCSAETVYKLSGELQVSMETLLAPYLEKRCSFELFKSNVCHQLKALGDINFIIQTLENNKIREYYDRQWTAAGYGGLSRQG